MVVVPSGSFLMGSPEGEEDRSDDEGPQHRVAIAEPFAIGVYEVTRGEFAAFVSATGYDAGDRCYTWDGEWKMQEGKNWRSPGFSQSDEHPVVCVSWDDAQAYVDWLADRSGEAYRLPSEAEWEYAARAGTTTAYALPAPDGSDDILSKGLANCYDCGGEWVSRRQTAPVGSFDANAFGLHDMHGNVWEWVEDCWSDSYAGAPANGSAWTRGDCGRRVLRGGSWAVSPRALRSADRFAYFAGDRINGYGFRVARTLGE